MIEDAAAGKEVIKPTPIEPQDLGGLLQRRHKPKSSSIVIKKAAPRTPENMTTAAEEPVGESTVPPADQPGHTPQKQAPQPAKRPAPSTPAAAQGSARRGRRPQSAAAKKAAAEQRGSGARPTTPQMTVNVAARTRALLNALRQHTPFNNTQNALRALDISDGRAAEIVRAHHERRRAAYEQSMGLSRFSAPDVTRMPTHKVPLSVRFDYQMQEVVDQIVEASGASGRGDLFDACIIAYVESLDLDPETLAPASLY
ncbi:hypothetical protein [Luteococcus sp.]|uniref:hypothetical protein n=1 Tax=Luteococcus sp. TaxID=1969402 RepID=UPI003735FF27